MELTEYRLGDVAKIVNGATPSTSCPEYYDGDIVWITPKDLSEQDSKYIEKGGRNITKEGFNSCSTQLIQPNNILLTSRAPIGLLAINKVECCTNQGFKNIVVDKNYLDAEYLYYYIKHHIAEIEALGAGTTFKEVSKHSLENYIISVPNLTTQKLIAGVLSNLDNKIALNKQINQNLEALARQLYDYWFVQFNFPDENGKPYKSSGGEMVYNEALKREIPKEWEVVPLNSFIKKNNTGDWGKDEPFPGCVKVGCIRGADIVKLNELPIRYIKNNTEKVLNPWDIVIEISGGSPTQSTGRCALITDGVIRRNGGLITCSNFCHAFSLQNIQKAPYFFYLWRTLYENDIMFNYEGKTSGLRNFMTAIFLANNWYDAPSHLTDIFFKKVNAIYSEIDKNIEENNALIKQRKELLPLLMNGQVNFDLSAD